MAITGTSAHGLLMLTFETKRSVARSRESVCDEDYILVDGENLERVCDFTPQSTTALKRMQVFGDTK